MRLHDFTLHHLRRALCLYLDLAFPTGSEAGTAVVPRPRIPDLAGPDDAPLQDFLHLFQDEGARPYPVQDVRDGRANRCYALRLGNAQYPFMKLRVQEMIVRDEFFFVVDTHDQMFCGKELDAELARLMAFNRALKCRIEAAWEGAGLPTAASVKGVVEGLVVERAPKRGLRILLVDDDAAIQDTIAVLLEGQGFDVDRAADGQEALEMVDPDRHALVLMDVEMPRMTGLEACEEMKSDERLARVPVLLATAGAVELARAAAPNGFLVKPFQPDALFRFLDTLLGPAAARHVSA